MREVSGSVCVLKKPGGRKNKHSVFEGNFSVIMCISRSNQEKWPERRVIPFSMLVLDSKQMRHCLHRVGIIYQIEYQTRKCRFGGSIIVRLILVSCPCVQIGICLVPGPSTCVSSKATIKNKNSTGAILSPYVYLRQYIMAYT